MAPGLRNPPTSSTRHHVTALAALAVYAEGLVSGARVLVLGGAPELEAHLRDLGARSVHMYDGDAGDLDVRDGAFDLAVVADVGRLRDAAGTVRRLRRLVDARGAVVALARATTEAADDAGEQDEAASFPEIAPAALGYAQLYDLFALQFDTVTMGGVLPFSGVVFAELGEAEDVAVSVDTRLAPAAAPDVFVVVASREARDLDPYAIVQTPASEERASTRDVGRDVVRDRESGPALAAAQLKSELLAAQLDELRARLAAAEARESRPAPSDESLEERRTAARRLDELAEERDAAVARIAELEGVLAAAQQALGVLEGRLVVAEQQMLERDDRLAALRGEIDALRSEGVDLAVHDPEIVAELSARAERAETALALNVADLAHVAEAHATETAALEAQLRERARVIGAMEKELARREQLVRELVSSLEEARDQGVLALPVSPPLPTVDAEDVVRLRRKLDDLALEVARREGELVAQQWRIEELERAAVAVPAERAGARNEAPARESRAGDVEKELAQTRDELDALRQALTQEHAARVAAESGEELTRARAELARQAALLEQMRGRGSHPGG